nr:hypothetical protein [Tanacetum cinerariifolium]
MNSFDDDLSELDSALREQILSNSKMEQLVTALSRQFQEMKEENARLENKELMKMLKTAQDRAEYYRESDEYYRHHLARVSWHYHQIMPPKRMTRAVIEKFIVDKVTEAVAANRAMRGNVGGSEGQGEAPPVRECSFAGYMKCNPTSFH